MKKVYALLFMVLMIFSLTACGAANEDGVSGSSPSVSKNESPTGSDNNSADDLSGADTSFSVTESVLPEQSGSGSRSQPEAPRILVAYFSATNTTKGVAEHISDALNADLYEITPAIPYTSADLNYHDDDSRSSIEMNDPSSRPEISGSVKNMEQYDIVFIGYPIWWGEAPRILSTFVESYDFSGKTIVPFCTSGSSGVGSSAANLEKLTSGAAWLPGTRFNGGTSRASIAEWINGLGLDISAV